MSKNFGKIGESIGRVRRGWAKMSPRLRRAGRVQYAPAEAMACGCHLIGFTGLAGGEFFDPATSTPVEEGKLPARVRAAERALLAKDGESQAMRQRAPTASAGILEEHSPEHQRADLLAFFGSLFSRHGAGAPTQAAVERRSGQRSGGVSATPEKALSCSGMRRQLRAALKSHSH